MKLNSKNRKRYYLKIHLIFCVKYRKQLLVNGLDCLIIKNIKDISQNKNFIIEEINSDKNHLHMLISYEPQITITSIVRFLKQMTTIYLWSIKYNLLKSHFYKEKTFWSDGYFVSSVGYANEEIINNYIKSQ